MSQEISNGAAKAERPVASVILAAGQGTRMASEMAKVLHPLASAPMLHHVMDAAAEMHAAKTVVVVGHQAEKVRACANAFDEDAIVVEQPEQLGTGHAVLQAKEALSGFEGDVMVLFGDTPLITKETLNKMRAERDAGAAIVVLGFEAADAGRYGRLILGQNGGLERIVEAKDASAEELAVTLCNSGVMCVEASTLFDLLSRVGSDNAQGEYYLTDIVALARANAAHVAVVKCDEAETLGVNSRADLAAAEAAWQARTRQQMLTDGVTLVSPETVHFAFFSYVGRDVVIEPNVVFGPDVTVESGAVIRAFSHLEGCHVSAGAIVGPYARLRPGAEIGGDAKVGNFVEVKNAVLGQGAKANHLSYIGDAEIGKKANIGAGTITCNYDGYFKHRTEIGEEAFIGSNSALVAPVKIGAGATVAAGATITRDVANNDLAVARAKQENKAGFALRMRQKLAKAKAALKK